MTAPAVAGAAGIDGSTAAADPSISLTGVGTISAGDLLVVCFCSTQTYSVPASTPSGWTHLYNPNSGVGTRSGDRDQVLYKIAAGGETSVTVSTSATSVKYTAAVLRITGHGTGTNAPEVATAATGTSTQPNAGSLTPSGGAKDYLFLAYAEQEGTATAGAAPSGYTQQVNQATTGGSAATNGRMVVASKQTTGASSDDPAAWSAWSASEDWLALTIAIYPSSGEAHSGTLVVTGGGVLTPASSTQRNRSGSLVGGGIISWAKATARNLAQLLTGGGIVTQAKTTNRNRAGALTGGGVDVQAQATNRNRSQLLTGGGILVVSGSASSSESHSGAAILTGGGVVNWIELTGRLATVQLTGGGQLLFMGGQDVALSDLGAVMCAIGDALEAANVASGRVFCYPPDAIDAPATVVGYPTEIEFDASMQRGADRLLIPVYYLTGKTSDRAAQAKIASIITGATGIKDVLDGDLGGEVQTLRVQSMRVLRVELAAIEYLAAVFTAEVFV